MNTAHIARQLRELASRVEIEDVRAYDIRQNGGEREGEEREDSFVLSLVLAPPKQQYSDNGHIVMNGLKHCHGKPPLMEAVDDGHFIIYCQVCNSGIAGPTKLQTAKLWNKCIDNSLHCPKNGVQ